MPNAVLLPHTGGGSNRQWDVDIPASLGKIAAFFGGEKRERRRVDERPSP